MIGHMRHGSPPRLIALQSILSPNRRESLPTPSAGVRITANLAAILRNDLCPACAPASGSTWVCPTDTGSCPLAWCRKAGPRAAQAWVVAAGLCGVRGGEGYFTRFHFDPAMPPADPLELVMVRSSPGMAAMRFCVSPAQFGKVLPSTLVV